MLDPFGSLTSVRPRVSRMSVIHIFVPIWKCICILVAPVQNHRFSFSGPFVVPGRSSITGLDGKRHL